MSTLSPNMLLPVPGVGTESAPTWATDLNTSLAIIDQHNHTPGSGVLITPAALDINSSLSFSSNFATSLAGMTLVAQAVQPANNTVYESGVDLYFVDGGGNNIQITANGGIAGSPGSISNLTSPASAAYVSGSKTFVWQSDVGIAANLDAGAVKLRNLSPNSTYAITLQAPSALSSNYNVVLPALPASQKIMTVDSSGNMAAPYTVDNSTITIAANLIGVPDGGITRPKQSAVGQQISSSCGTFSTSSATFVDITNLTVTITTTGRPVMLLLLSTTSGGYFSWSTSTLTVEPGFQINYVRGSTSISSPICRMALNSSYINETVIPCGAFGPYLDVPAAGTYTYKIQMKKVGADSVGANEIKLAAYEL